MHLLSEYKQDFEGEGIALLHLGTQFGVMNLDLTPKFPTELAYEYNIAKIKNVLLLLPCPGFTHEIWGQFQITSKRKAFLLDM
jgi:hypothetical protein